ncbi:MAG: gamma-glutamyltransferase [Oleiphilaceae bacterium]|nr:gamma-glutamyltransferase [Oleiphilaceae bacterium]
MLIRPVLLVALLTGCASLSTNGEPERPAPAQVVQPAAATAHPLATDAAMAVMAAGGNAYDAAVAAAAVLGVVEPYSAGLGGGGFWLLRDRDGQARVIDARETAPGEAHPGLYLDEDGDVLAGNPSLNGPLAAGIPGQPAALAHISETHGQLPLAVSLAEAIRMAGEGFAVDERYQRLAQWRAEVMARDETTREIFLAGGEQAPEKGTRIRQPALAQTLQTLASEGRSGFYEGELAQRLVADVRQAGGIWRVEDLRDYALIEREPVRIRHGDAEILTAPAPSAGGIALSQMFTMLEIRPAPESTAGRVHHLAEIMRRAYHDRAFHLGDPDYTDIPTEALLSREYLRQRADSINPDRATPSDSLTGLEPGGRDTTHLSVVDASGNMVSATLSINYPFGAAVTSPATGVLLNNEMDDFSIKPGEPNVYGLVGGQANQVQAGKRPLSSMSPSILITPDAHWVLGTPGGSRIITMNFLALLAALEGADPETVVAQPRFHHQYRPDQIQHEPGAFSADVAAALVEKGHHLEDVGREYGNMQLIRIHPDGRSEAASDPRGRGAARAGETPQQRGGGR